MGDKKTKRAKFIQQHSMCCFCGGEQPTETIDHVPSRQYFNNRAWPEGYEFPACVACNESTSHEEQVIAMLSRANPGPSSDQNGKEFKKVLDGVANNSPGVLQEMMMTTRDVRSFIKERNIKLPANFFLHDLPIVSVKGPLIQQTVAVFGVKLLCALHYKHTGTIVPLSGGISMRWYTNVNIQDGALSDQEFLKLFRGQPQLVRCNATLDNQFYYSFTAATEASAYLIKFRESFVIAGFVYIDDKLIPPIDGMVIYRPRKPDRR